MKINLRSTHLIVTLGFFGLPLGLGNNLAQPVAMLLLIPIIASLVNKSWRSIPLLLLVTSSSIYNAIAYQHLEHSLYQFIRSGLPFAFLCILLTCYKELSLKISTTIQKINTNSPKIIDRLITAYAAGQLLQIALFKSGLDLANAASKTETLDRVLLFPTTASILIFLYACITRKHIMMCITAAVLLAAGSKAVLAAMLVMFAISILKTKNIKTFTSYIAAGATLVILIFAANPLALERINEFLHESRGADITREYEIFHAKQSFLHGPDTILFGNGLGKQLTPGVPTNDPKWFENSKFDIENGYWGIIAKLGIVGAALFIIMLARLPINTFTLAALFIWVLFSFKTSYQFFTTFDGCYLLLWAAVITALTQSSREALPTVRPAL